MSQLPLLPFVAGILIATQLGCQASSEVPAAQPARRSVAATVTANPTAPTTGADEAAAIEALETILLARGENPEPLRITRAPNGDETIPLQWWTDHDSGKPYQVVDLWAEAGYQGHPNWHFLLWKTSKDAPWELVSEGKS